MTSYLDDGAWEQLTEPQKRVLRDKLAEACVQNGITINDTIHGPLQLATQHERQQVTRPHLQLIGQALTNLLATPNGKLMVFCPPQSGKSTLASRWFPFWWLTKKPSDRIIVASYAASLAQTHGAACRDLIAGYGAQYGLKLKPDESTRSDWTLTTGGGLRARGVRSGLTGQSMDVGIIDDPYADRQQADSPTIRAAVWNWYSSAFVTRQAPGARQILTMTRWHQDDLAGQLLEREGRVEDGGQWTVLHLPAIAVPISIERDIRADQLGRTPGQPLTHPQIDTDDQDELLAHWKRRRSATTNRDWNALYQGTPFDSTGGLLSEQMIRDRTGTPGTAKRTGVGVDPSGGGRDTAGIIAGHLDTTGKFWWTHSRSARMSSDVWPRETCLLAHEVNADRIIFESNYGGDQSLSLIKQAWDALQREKLIPMTAFCPLITGVHSRKSKILRAEPIAQAVQTGRAWFGPDESLRDLKSEWQLWEVGSSWSPGALDAAVHLCYEILPAVNSGASVTSVASRRKDVVSVTPGGVAARRKR